MARPCEADHAFASLAAALRTGDANASTTVFRLYVRRLVALAAQRLDAETLRLSEPEDVVQSAFRSFFAGMKDGEYELDGWGGLWGLLALITLRKCRKQRRRNRARKRSAARRVEWPWASGRTDEAPADREPSPMEAAMLSEVVQQLFEGLQPPERAIVELTLLGHETRAIAQRLDRSERTVQRVRQGVREHLEALITDEAADRPD